MKRLRVLVIDDAPGAAALPLLHEIGRGYAVSHERVASADALRAALAREAWDLVIAEYAAQALDGPAALRLLAQSGLDLPCFVVSDSLDEGLAVAALRAGASDFLVRSRLERLLPAIERELREGREREQRRAAERLARECAARDREIVATAPAGIWLVDADGCTSFANQRLCELLGCPLEALLGAALLEFVDDESKAQASRVLSPAAARAEAVELRFLRRDGSRFWAALMAQPIIDGSGRRRGALALLADVSERRVQQAQLMVAERLEAVGTLAAAVAHEISNPLASAIANLDLSAVRLDELSTQPGNRTALIDLREQLHDATEAARRVQGIVHDLKLFSRTQEEKQGPVDVRVVLDSVVRLAEHEVAHRARVVKNYGEVPLVNANEGRLGQLFLNLLTNAAHAIPEGCPDRHAISLSTTALDGERVMIEVRDDGSGMSLQVLERLFMPFFTTKPLGAGTGLGLALCHRIVSALGGEINVESQLGAGSAFKVVLPGIAAAPELAAAAAAPTPAAMRRGRVLAVDDEPMMVRVIQRMLALDHDVAGSIGADDALEWIKAGQRFDVILCDLMMPRISGMDFHAELRRIAPDQAQRMIFLTGGAFTSRVRAFLDEVDNLRIEKPFEPASLRAIIDARVASTRDA